MQGQRALVAPPLGEIRRHPRLRLATSVALVALLIGGSAVSYLRSLSVRRLIPGLKLQSRIVGSIDHERLSRIV